MKELNFKDVITNIKEGEVWLSSVYEIRKDKEGLQIKRLDKNVEQDDGIPFMYFYDSNHTFTLQRKQYTFEEAFKALEEGKQIESVISRRGFKSRDICSKYILFDSEIVDRVNDEFRLFSCNEIRGRWYIKD